MYAFFFLEFFVENLYFRATECEFNVEIRTLKMAALIWESKYKKLFVFDETRYSEKFEK